MATSGRKTKEDGTVRVLMSFPPKFLEKIDEVAASLFMNRSEFVRQVLREDLHRRNNKNNLDLIDLE